MTLADGCRERSGGLVGGQIGYRWQASQWVFGLEAQGDWADLSNTRLSLFNPRFSTRTKTDGIGLFTGQIGYAWNASLFYVKGGAAVTDNRFSILIRLPALSLPRQARPAGVAPWVWDGSTASHRIGLPVSNTTTCSWATANNSFSVVNPTNAALLNNRISQDVDMVTVRINYKFGGYGGPARY